MAGSDRIAFCAAQRARLEALGLSERQIVELERACAYGKLRLAKPLKVVSVRNQLEILQGRLRRGTSMDALSGGKPMKPERESAALLLSDAAVRLGGYRLLAQAAIPRARLAQMFDLIRLPYQSRHRSADPLPVQLIWRALIDAHDPKLPNPIRLTSSPGSTFRRIVGVCYEAMTGRGRADPERAIKSFVSLDKLRERGARHEAEIDLAALGVPSAKARGRPRKTLVPGTRRK